MQEIINKDERTSMMSRSLIIQVWHRGFDAPQSRSNLLHMSAAALRSIPEIEGDEGARAGILRALRRDEFNSATWRCSSEMFSDRAAHRETSSNSEALVCWSSLCCIRIKSSYSNSCWLLEETSSSFCPIILLRWLIFFDMSSISFLLLNAAR